MALTTLLLLNIVIHLVVGTGALRKLLIWQRIKTSWQQAILTSAAVIIGMNLLSRALTILGIKTTLTLPFIIIWTIAGSAGFLTHTYHLKKNKLYLITAIWAIILLATSLLIGFIDAIILSL